MTADTRICQVCSPPACPHPAVLASTRGTSAQGTFHNRPIRVPKRNTITGAVCQGTAGAPPTFHCLSVLLPVTALAWVSVPPYCPVKHCHLLHQPSRASQREGGRQGDRTQRGREREMSRERDGEEEESIERERSKRDKEGAPHALLPKPGFPGTPSSQPSTQVQGGH